LKKTKKERLTWSRVFDPDLKEGDFVRFIHGKVVWRIQPIWGQGTIRLRSLRKRYGASLYISPRQRHRLYKIRKEEAFLWILKHYPQNLRLFEEDDLKEIAEHLYLKE